MSSFPLLFDLGHTPPTTRDIANTVHCDGAKDEPCLLMLVGTGPMVTTRKDAAKK